MVLDGALDQGTEQDLAKRLGVSARHLRRLFIAHLGVTPDGLARSARVHFARRLLDDTDLTVTEIAFAAGFGSLRQFNRACREVFRESPRMLRARRRKADRLVADGGLLLRLPFMGPLDWPFILEQFAAHSIPGVEHVNGETYRRTVMIDGDPGVLELSAGGPDYLLLRGHLPYWSELVHLVQRARAIASLDFGIEEAVAVLGVDAVLGPLLRARAGVRPPGAWDPFEVGVRAIIEAHLQPPRARVATTRLVRRFGASVPGLEQFGLTHTFPAPSAIASGELRDIGVPRPCAGTVRSFARAVVGDRVRLDRSVRLGDLIGSMTEIDGIDERTAQYVALRLGEPDAYPAKDDSDPGAAEHWRPWRALAATHSGWWTDRTTTAEGFGARPDERAAQPGLRGQLPGCARGEAD
jgi:AraC family transcriptional regulator, regulatory protein of adaptative response / DNA-3-methyladenine glycosylase II